MKMLFMTEFYPPSADAITGGVEARSWYVTQMLGRKHDVTVVCSHQPGLPRQARVGPVEVKRVGPTFAYTTEGSLVQRALFMIAAYREGKKIPCDVVEGSSILSYSVAYYVAQYHRVPAVAWVPDVLGTNWVRFFHLPGLFVWALEQFSSTRSWDRLIAISNVVSLKLARLRQSRRNIVVIPCGVNQYEFLGRPPRREGSLLVWAGRFVAYKEPLLFLHAVEKLRVSFPDVHAVMVGHGPLQRKLEDEIARLSLKSTVSLKIHLSRRAFVSLLRRAILFVQTSTVEGFGIVVLEALAAGTPAVVPDLPVYHETTQGKGVIIAKANDVKDLAEKIGGFFSGRDVRDLQREGRRHAEKYDWRVIAEQTRDKYQAIVRPLHRPM